MTSIIDLTIYAIAALLWAALCYWHSDGNLLWAVANFAIVFGVATLTGIVRSRTR